NRAGTIRRRAARTGRSAARAGRSRLLRHRRERRHPRRDHGQPDRDGRRSAHGRRRPARALRLERLPRRHPSDRVVAAAAMWFAYVDESFNPSQHWVAALLVHHTRVNETARALRDVVDHASAEFGIDPTAELHGHDLFHGTGEFAPMKTVPRARIALYASALQTLVDADCWIILRGVSRPGLLRRYGAGHEHPHRIVMTHLLERIDMFCHGTRGGDDHAVVVADEHHETQSTLLRDLVTYQDRGTW